MRGRVSDTDYWRLKILVHTHDAFKGESVLGVSITDPQSHASLARAFLEEFCDDVDLLAMVQYHDEGFALWKQWKAHGECNQERLAGLLAGIRDWNTFLAFIIVDGCTEGKRRDPLRWLFQQVKGRVQTDFEESDIF